MSIARITFTVLGRGLTILVGAAPATYLCFMAYFVALVGFVALLSGEAEGLIFMIWGLAGFYGTASLWAVAFGFVRGWSIVGLCAGTLAMLPFAGPYLNADIAAKVGANPDSLLFVGPVLVALGWFLALAVRLLCRPMFRAPEHVEA